MKKKRYLPFGYQMEKGEIIPHPDEGPLVQAIFSKGCPFNTRQICLLVGHSLSGRSRAME